MIYKIDDLEGIDSAHRERLAAVSILTTGDLLAKCCSPAGRREVSERTKIGSSQLLRWANMADLMRLHGVGRQHAELLEASGVDTVKELRTRRADSLTAKMIEINRVRKLTKVAPAVSAVQRWIDQAKVVDPKISH